MHNVCAKRSTWYYLSTRIGMFRTYVGTSRKVSCARDKVVSKTSCNSGGKSDGNGSVETQLDTGIECSRRNFLESGFHHVKPVESSSNCVQFVPSNEDIAGVFCDKVSGTASDSRDVGDERELEILPYSTYNRISSSDLGIVNEEFRDISIYKEYQDDKSKRNNVETSISKSKITYETNKFRKQNVKKNQSISESRIVNTSETSAQVEASSSSTDVVSKTSTSYRQNSVNIQMLSESLFKQVFSSQSGRPSIEKVQKACNHLKVHGLLEKQTSTLPDVNFELPKLYGNDIDEHFRIIAEKQGKPYKQLVTHLLEQGIPEIPLEWEYKPGWTKYLPNGTRYSVAYPEEEAIVFDVEVCRTEGELPTMATAVSSTAWYSWVSHHAFNDHIPVGHRVSLDDMIPLESERIDTPSSVRNLLPRIVVGHNVAFDRARVKEQYWLEGTKTKFLDTMSLHISVSGITSYQRAQLVSVSKSKDEAESVTSDDDTAWMNYSSLNNLSDVHKLYCGSPVSKERRDIFITGSFSDIRNDFQNLMTYCAQDVIATYEILKQILPIFFERFPHPVTFAGMLEVSTAYLPVNSNWRRYIRDADDTYEDLENEVKFSLMQQADAACSYFHENKYEDDPWLWDLDWSVQELKLKKATKRREKGLDDTRVDKQDTENINCEVNSDNDEDKDVLEEKFAYLTETEKLLPVKLPHLPGYPLWYRKLCPRIDDNLEEWQPGPQSISTSMKIVPKLLRLIWEMKYPLQYSSKYGWGFFVPLCDTFKENIEGSPTENTKTDKKYITSKVIKSLVTMSYDDLTKDISKDNVYAHDIDIAVLDYESKKNLYKRKRKKEGEYKETGLFCYEDIKGLQFYKLPHKDGPRRRVGNPLAKDFLNKVSDNTLSTSAGDLAKKVLSISKMLTYWRNNNERIKSQLVVSLDKRTLPRRVVRDVQFIENGAYGAILPQVIVCGTLTRRAVEPTWLTASNAYPERVGSELRALVQAPPSYHIVGADVDSEELWIASVIGDAYFAGIHGCTALGWMTLQGKKSEKTDTHSMTAATVGISRDQAKIINYARIYGAGQQFAEQLLLQFNPTMSKVEARKKAKDTFTYTKGHRIYYLRKEFLNEVNSEDAITFEDKAYSRQEVFDICKRFQKDVDDIFCEPRWEGGTESAMFNRLEEIAKSKYPSTPFLGSRISRALEPEQVDDDFLRTRINWVVQSSAVDFLHLMLVCMRWLIDKYLPGARFCLSFHDEIRYLVPSPFRYEAALALHITNLLSRSFCSFKLGINDLPQSVAFFSSVDVDKVLRKEINMDCRTPSNPHGMSLGYGIEAGESVDIYSALDKSGGSFHIYKKEDKKAYRKKGVRK